MRQPILGIFRERRDIEEFVFKAFHYEQAYHEIIDQLNEKGVYVAVLMVPTKATARLVSTGCSSMTMATTALRSVVRLR